MQNNKSVIAKIGSAVATAAPYVLLAAQVVDLLQKGLEQMAEPKDADVIELHKARDTQSYAASDNS